MRYTRVAVMLVVALALGAAGTYADSDWLKGNTDEKLKTLAEIQPGLGTVMIEYGTRYTTAYYAAKGGNWDLAAYQIKEALEIQEVGETTRPGRAQALKAFEKNYLEPLNETIKAKDFKKFDKAFKDGIQGCNTCHIGQGFPYIKYQLPKAPISPLSMKP
ncbi:MAG: hypothetical protein ACHQ7N_14315 [Candidatus Methylomirabilales bacterium]